jgi:hypothetical protein
MIGFLISFIGAVGALSVALVLMLVVVLTLLYHNGRIIFLPARGLGEYTRRGVAIFEVGSLMILISFWACIVSSLIEFILIAVRMDSIADKLSEITRVVFLFARVIFENYFVLCGVVAFDELYGRYVHVLFAPTDALCPITLDVMQTPVRTRCGHIFELDAISNWVLQGNGLCPLCRRQLVP